LIVAGGHVTNANDEAVARESTAGELAGVGMSLHHLELRRPYGRPLVKRSCGLRYGKPLDSDRTPILEAGIADIHVTALANLCKLTSDPLSVRIVLTHLQQDVLARPGRRESQVFFYDEVIGLGSQHPRTESGSECARRLEGRNWCHAAINSTTA
jgi:hypothetical protein